MKQFVLFTALVATEEAGALSEDEVARILYNQGSVDSSVLAFNNLTVATRIHQAIKDKLNRHYDKGDCDLFESRHSSKKDADA